MSCKENKNAHERSGDNSFCLSITTPYIQDNNNEGTKTVLQKEHLST